MKVNKHLQVKELQNAGVPQNAGFAITSVKMPYFEKNNFFGEVTQRALFKTLVITVVFKS